MFRVIAQIAIRQDDAQAAAGAEQFETAFQEQPLGLPPLQQAGGGLPGAGPLGPAMAQLILPQPVGVGNGQVCAEGGIGQDPVELTGMDFFPDWSRPLPGGGQGVQAMDLIPGFSQQAELGAGKGGGEGIPFPSGLLRLPGVALPDCISAGGGQEAADSAGRIQDGRPGRRGQ